MQKFKKLLFIITAAMCAFIWIGLLITGLFDIPNTGFIVFALIMLIITVILAVPLSLLALLLGFHKEEISQKRVNHLRQTINPTNSATIPLNDDFENYKAKIANTNQNHSTLDSQATVPIDNIPQEIIDTEVNVTSPTKFSKETDPIEKRLNELLIENPSYTEDELKDIIIQEEKSKITNRILSKYKIEIIGGSKRSEVNSETQDTKINLSYSKARKLVANFVVLDFETTGLSHLDNEIIQMAAIRYVNFEEIDKFVTFVKPNLPIPSRITKINGISDYDVKDAPTIDTALPLLIDFISNDIIVAHNASFDMKFLLANIHKVNIDYKKFRVIDTLSLARKHIDSTTNHKLPTLKVFLELHELQSHEALHDCYVTAALYKHCYFKSLITS